MANVDDFLEKFFRGVTRAVLMEAVIENSEYFKLDVGDNRLKENIKAIIKSNLSDLKLHVAGPAFEVFDEPSFTGSGFSSFSFEQRKDLLMMQTELQKLALEKLRREAELKRLEMEKRRLRGSDAEVGNVSLGAHGRWSSSSFDVVSNLRLVREQDLNIFYTFFSLFERMSGD